MPQPMGDATAGVMHLIDTILDKMIQHAELTKAMSAKITALENTCALRAARITTLEKANANLAVKMKRHNLVRRMENMEKDIHEVKRGM